MDAEHFKPPDLRRSDRPLVANRGMLAAQVARLTGHAAMGVACRVVKSLIRPLPHVDRCAAFGQSAAVDLCPTSMHEEVLAGVEAVAGAQSVSGV